MGKDKNSEYKSGLITVIVCQLIWGVLPIYWASLTPIPSWIIIMYRMFTMCVYCYIVSRFSYSNKEILEPLKKDKSLIWKHFIAGAILAINWSTYIWAMTTGRMVQSSIGYYLEPLVICLFGIFIFKEKLTKYNATAMLLALIALSVMLIHYGQLPGVALILAFSWACYSAIKKTTKNSNIVELVYETFFFAIIALIGILVIETKGIGGLSYGVPGKYALMFLSGLVTLVPVVLFGMAARKVSLFVIGLTQYLSPTITLALGIFAYGEPVDKVQIIAFIVIWIGLAIFSYGEFKTHHESNQ